MQIVTAGTPFDTAALQQARAVWVSNKVGECTGTTRLLLQVLQAQPDHAHIVHHASVPVGNAAHMQEPLLCTALKSQVTIQWVKPPGGYEM